MVPTLAATLGVKGHRPEVGTRDHQGLLYVFAVRGLTTGALHTTTLACSGKKKKPGEPSKNRRMQEAFADHLRHVGRMYPRERHRRVVLVIDKAPPGIVASWWTRRGRRTRTWSPTACRRTVPS
jgi:hypothetical protein